MEKKTKTMHLTKGETSCLKCCVRIAEWILHEYYTDAEKELQGFSWDDFNNMREKIVGAQKEDQAETSADS